MPKIKGFCLQQVAAENSYKRKPRGRGIKRAKSHYQFSSWKWDENGERYAAPLDLGPDCPRKTADLLNTAIYNKSSGNFTLMYLALDLDFKRCSKRWITRGQMDWAKIEAELKSSHPQIYSAVSRVVRSHGGKGLHLWFPISPLLMTEKYRKQQEFARALLRYLHQLFDHLEMGLDFSASGLGTDFANFFNTKKVVHSNDFQVKRAHNNNRFPILNELMDYLKTLKFCGYQKKSEDENLLYPDARAEHKFARLYVDLFKAWEEGEDLLLTQTQLQKLTRLSANTVKKTLHGEKKLAWACIRKDDGRLWKFTFNPNSSPLMQRAEALIRDGKVECKLDMGRDLQEPFTVIDGERNDWIARASVKLKWKGVEEDRAYDIIDELCERIPGSEGSRNCRYNKNTVRSIYRSHKYTKTFGSRPELVLPVWLENPALARPEKSPSQTVTKLQKGLQGSPGEQLEEQGRSVSSCVETLNTLNSQKPDTATKGKSFSGVFKLENICVRSSSQTYGNPPEGEKHERSGTQISLPSQNPEFSETRVSDPCEPEGISGAKTQRQTPVADGDIEEALDRLSRYLKPVQFALFRTRFELSTGAARKKLETEILRLAEKARTKEARNPVPRPRPKKNHDPLGSILGRFGKKLE